VVPQDGPVSQLEAGKARRGSCLAHACSAGALFNQVRSCGGKGLARAQANSTGIGCGGTWLAFQ